MIAPRETPRAAPRRRLPGHRFCPAWLHSDRFQPGVEPSVEEHEKSESRGLQGLSFPGPAVGLFARRTVEPETCVGKGPTQLLEDLVSGIVVTVETEISRSAPRLRNLLCHAHALAESAHCDQGERDLESAHADDGTGFCAENRFSDLGSARDPARPSGRPEAGATRTDRVRS